jgi:hypothetical protein
MPSYPTLRRFMKANGLDKRRRVTSRQTDGADRAEDKLADRATECTQGRRRISPQRRAGRRQPATCETHCMPGHLRCAKTKIISLRHRHNSDLQPSKETVT